MRESQKKAGRSSSSAKGGIGAGYSMDYMNALEIQRSMDGSSRRSSSGGRVTSKQEIALRNKTLSKTAAATDRARKNMSGITAPERGGMVPARKKAGKLAPTSKKGLDLQQLGLRNKTLKDTPPAATPAKKKVQSVVAPQRGGMVATGRRGSKSRSK